MLSKSYIEVMGTEVKKRFNCFLIFSISWPGHYVFMILIIELAKNPIKKATMNIVINIMIDVLKFLLIKSVCLRVLAFLYASTAAIIIISIPARA